MDTAPASSAAAPALKTTRFVELEGYRGLAAIMIIVFHAHQQSRFAQTYVYERTPLHHVLRNLDAAVSMFAETYHPVHYGPLANLDTFAMGMLLALIYTVTGAQATLRHP